MNSVSLESFAGADWIAILSGLKERAVRTNLQELVRAGWLTERTQRRGRDYWLKIRRAALPIGLPAEAACSHKRKHPAANAGSHDAREPRLPANKTGLRANGAATPCKLLHGHPAASAGDLVLEDLVKDLALDLGAVGADRAASLPPAAAGSAAILDRIRDEVWRLHDDGLDAAKIARRLRADRGAACGVSTGHVQAVLSEPRLVASAPDTGDQRNAG